MEQTEVKRLTAEPVRPEQKEKTPLQAPKKRKKLPKWAKRVIVIAVIAALLLIALSRCMSRGANIIAGAYLPAEVTRQDMVVSVSGTGTIEPIHAYEATTLVRGEVIAAPFEEGDTVQEGDLLFQIDAQSVESSIEQAEIALAQAQLAYNDLLTNQKNAALSAPKAGVVQKLYVSAGDTVTAGAPIADIVDRSTVTLEVPFHASDAKSFSVGQGAVVTVDGTMETLNGTISAISGADEVGAGGALLRRVTVRVSNPGALSPSSRGTATVGGVACASGSAFAYNAQTTLYAKTGGEIGSLSVREGDTVRKDQTIAVFATDSISTQIENARLGVQSAELALRNARQQLENYSITSPITGTVIEKNVEVGDNIDGSATASAAGITYPAVIYDLSSLVFEMKIHELDINKIKVGQTVEITASALEGQTFTGVVDKVNINGSTVGGVTTYPVTVAVQGGQALLPGMNVSAKILVEEARGALCIPVEAVSRGNVVLVAGPGCLDENGAVTDITRIEERTVVLGRNNDEWIEVLEGLEEGEHVLIENQSSSILDMVR